MVQQQNDDIRTITRASLEQNEQMRDVQESKVAVSLSGPRIDLDSARQKCVNIGSERFGWAYV
ncbi:MAG: hypothetical protein ACOH2Q_20940 [Rhodococcus sp. (in: high G+C Gram-positive bacteria)]